VDGLIWVVAGGLERAGVLMKINETPARLGLRPICVPFSRGRRKLLTAGDLRGIFGSVPMSSPKLGNNDIRSVYCMSILRKLVRWDAGRENIEKLASAPSVWAQVAWNQLVAASRTKRDVNGPEGLNGPKKWVLD
jgi:hypothetical protein